MKFFKNMYQKSKEQKGFTLVEMIVVLVIIAILAAITIPALLKYIDKAKDKQLVINARTAYLAAETAVGEAYGVSGSSGVVNFSFDEDDKDNKLTTTSTVADKLAKNASELASMSNSFTCEVKVGTNSQITEVQYKEGTKTATLNVSSGSEWTVK